MKLKRSFTSFQKELLDEGAMQTDDQSFMTRISSCYNVDISIYMENEKTGFKK